jgi:enoyl-CoA hydratase/carnithine racemase
VSNDVTDYEKIDFSPIQALTEGEVVTRSTVRDIRLASGKTLALITLDNGRDHTRPNTLGPATLTGLGETLATLKARAAAGEIQAVGITGKQYILAAGADLSDISRVGSKDNARLIAQLGHKVIGSLSDLGVPSFAFINGLGLGGGHAIAPN